MNFRLSTHALERSQERGITPELIEQIIQFPQQVVVADAPTIYQSVLRIGDSGAPYLYRIFVNTGVQPPLVVTAYRTSQISKYYEGEI